MYNELYRAWKTEKTSQVAQPLSRDFYQRMETYLNGLSQDSASMDGHTMQGKLLGKERDVSKRLLDELRETRLQKIIDSAKDGNSIPMEGLTEEEENLAVTLNNALSSFKGSESELKQTPLPEASSELVVVRFLEEIPEIVGVDLKIYGPYKKEDVGSLPAQNAQGLIKQGAAKLVEVRGIVHPA